MTGITVAVIVLRAMRAGLARHAARPVRPSAPAGPLPSRVERDEYAGGLHATVW
ncbi:hypothetical protein [Methylobacterium nonmethylotrophicum]|uniref:hypothetical protein n=1 Tax=Methylobacterium nonmethylotrophicum TaxID=1141884 RepID=UPI0014369B3B|nr:hypothetical protein [Methylobacterium nonmethylotrophicum]